MMCFMNLCKKTHLPDLLFKLAFKVHLFATIQRFNRNGSAPVFRKNKQLFFLLKHVEIYLKMYYAKYFTKTCALYEARLVR